MFCFWCQPECYIPPKFSQISFIMTHFIVEVCKERPMSEVLSDIIIQDNPIEEYEATGE